MKPAVEWIRSPSRPRELLPSRRATRSSGKLDPLEGGTEDELARVQNERLCLADLDQLGQVFHLLLDVDERVAGVPEDAEEAVDAYVQAGRLQEGLVIGLDLDPALRELAPDGAIGQNHAGVNL